MCYIKQDSEMVKVKSDRKFLNAMYWIFLLKSCVQMVGPKSGVPVNEQSKI